MRDPVRLRILKALTLALQQITPANGYYNDLTASVFRGRDYFGQNDELPMVSILEAPLQPEQVVSPRGADVSTGEWDIMIQGWVVDDAENPTDPAHFLMADVKKALGRTRKRGRGQSILDLGNDVIDMNIAGGTVRPPDELSANAYFWLMLKLKISEDFNEEIV